MFIVALFSITRIWNQSKQPSTDEWIRKLCYKYTMGHCLGMKKNEVSIFVAKWTGLEVIIK